MEESHTSPKCETQKVELVLRMDGDDAAKLIAAFKEGKLKELGVIDLVSRPSKLAGTAEGLPDWTTRTKPSKPSGKDIQDRS